MRHYPENEYFRAYMLGFAHSLTGLPYWDGTGPSHRQIAIVPGCAFTNPLKEAYRDGWLDGQAVMTAPISLRGMFHWAVA